MIALVGDSITFGYGVRDDETLGANLGKLLPAYDIQNAGVPGYHIRQEASLYREMLAPLQPEVLVLVFDWGDEDLQTSFLDAENVLRPEGWKSPERMCHSFTRGILSFLPGQCFLDRHSALFRGLKEFVDTRSAFRERDRLRKEQPDVPQKDSFDLPTYAREFKELALMAPAKRLFVIWPDMADLRNHERSKLHTLAQSEGFVVLDLTEHFGNTMETLSWDYLHPSPASLTEAAKTIHTALITLLLK